MTCLIERIYELLEPDSRSDNDVADRLVARFVHDHQGCDLVATVFASVALDADARHAATFFDVLLWPNAH